MTPPDKTCATCGRPFSWRKKWARNWDEIRYCSDACRRHKPDAADRALEAALRAALDRTGRADPEAAVRVSGGDATGGAARTREAARRAARRIAATGEAEVVQHGRVVDAGTARGPFELRRRP